jgi:uncharacterized protein (PEP-CTERM system associated)
MHSLVSSARAVFTTFKCGASVTALCLASTAAALAQTPDSGGSAAADAPIMVAQAETGFDGRLSNAGGFDLRGALDVTDAREFSITPRLGVLESFTDNVLLSPTNQEHDFITRFNLDNQLNVNTGRTLVSVNSTLSYDKYATHDELDGWSIQGIASGTYAAIPGFLYLDAEGQVSYGTVTTFGTSAVDRSGTNGRVQLATYNLGPRITTTIGDFADLLVRGRFAQVHHDTEDAAVATLLPTNSNIYQASAVASTGERFQGFQFDTAGNYQADDHDFRSYNGTQSVYFRVMPSLRLLARGGYEHVELPLVTSIDSPIWSAGFEYSLNEESRITLEGGERYNRTNWTAEAVIRLGSRLLWTASYRQALQPSQVSINDSFQNFMDFSRLITTPGITPGSPLFGNLIDQPSLTKTAETHLLFQTERDVLDFALVYDEHRFVTVPGRDSSLQAAANYMRRLAPDLSLDITGAYGRTFSSTVFGESETMRAEIGIGYQLNSTWNARAGYAISHSTLLSPVSATVLENAAFVSLEKTF